MSSDWPELIAKLRRLPEINVPDWAGFSFPCKARPPAHSELCNGGRNEAGERKDKQAGTFIDRNRLRRSMDSTRLPRPNVLMVDDTPVPVVERRKVEKHAHELVCDESQR